MYSLKALNNSFKTFAHNHARLNSYGYGDTYNLTAALLTYNATGSTGAIAYPVMWVMPEQSSIERRMFKVNYKIIFGDALLDDYRNVDAVLSDTALTMGDFMAWLVQSAGQNPEAFSIDNAYSYSATPFMDDSNGMFPDKVAGWNLDIGINIINTNNLSQIPNR